MLQKEDILFEDNHLIVLNKKAGQLVQADKDGSIALEEEVKQYIKEKYNKPGDVFCGIIHRIDRPVSGLTIFARTSKALARMNEVFRERDVKKVYWAIVKKAPEKKEDTLIHFITRNEKINKSKAHLKEVHASQKAELSYKTLAQSDNYTLLEIDLKTGRHHQIRAQLTSIGSPIKGDLKYGFDRSNPDGSISLHSRYCEFKHPVKDELIKIIAPAPKDSLWQYFEKL